MNGSQGSFMDGLAAAARDNPLAAARLVKQFGKKAA
jgi:hypothetical protein